MATIRVPGPPAQAFRKNRPVSDLLKSQIKHFQHLEHKLHLSLPTKFSPQDLTTEATAAQYIAEITTALCSRAITAQQVPTPIRVVPSAKPKPTHKPARQPQEISIAASAAPKKSHAKKHAAKKHPKHPRKKS